MKDLNFFDSYLTNKKVNINKQIIYYLFMISLIIIIGAFAICNQISIGRMQKEVIKLKSIVEDDRVTSKVEEISDKQSELESLKGNLQELESYNRLIEKNSKLNDSLFEMLTASIPEGVFLTSVSMYSEEINIVGKAKDQLLIAQMVDNIESFQVFKRAFVSSISKEENFYSFLLDISLKDVNTDGENTTIIEETDN